MAKVIYLLPNVADPQPRVEPASSRLNARKPDDHDRLELTKFQTPTAVSAEPEQLS